MEPQIGYAAKARNAKRKILELLRDNPSGMSYTELWLELNKDKDADYYVGSEETFAKYLKEMDGPLISHVSTDKKYIITAGGESYFIASAVNEGILKRPAPVCIVSNNLQTTHAITSSSLQIECTNGLSKSEETNINNSFQSWVDTINMRYSGKIKKMSIVSISTANNS